MNTYKRALCGLTFGLFTILSIGLPNTIFAQENAEDGKFVFQIKEPEDKDLLNAYELVKEGEFEKTIDRLNEIIKLPYDMDIVFDQADRGPHYLPGEKKIVMSYDMMNIVAYLYAKAYPDEKDRVREDAVNVNLFFLFHEITHALIDVHKLPVVGDEETTADNLATIIALEYMPNGLDIVLDAVDFFDLLGQNREDSMGESAYWDEHRMDGQRYYYILCLAYGKNPKAVAEELESYDDEDINNFIKEKGQACIYNYKDSVAKWTQILSPYLKEVLPDSEKESSEDSENN